MVMVISMWYRGILCRCSLKAIIFFLYVSCGLYHLIHMGFFGAWQCSSSVMMYIIQANDVNKYVNKILLTILNFSLQLWNLNSCGHGNAVPVYLMLK